ncbi:hypothetical protein Cob_v004857 [Colletotrichum orbiculare MAFF 240422]|uniref:Uncharacterized protein n=1 Tax=Colletotrichum orbiculare (strain 104-T / ATCC 96160 / CBS 514.97 / LARS 414 / MAFF 240422) TaxID=1213857 RepID=A0A484FWK8_COLOR|nr:hypothetical protein Cob_v004857 [Colletotrichum orbiculare MAFF 240422]
MEPHAFVGHNRRHTHNPRQELNTTFLICGQAPLSSPSNVGHSERAEIPIWVSSLYRYRTQQKRWQLPRDKEMSKKAKEVCV